MAEGMPRSPALNHSALTDMGLRRQNNEDCLLARPDLGLYAVADGMGGHAAGEVASAICTDALATCIASGGSLSQALNAAHTAVLDAVAAGRGGRGMGSTLVALHQCGAIARIAWVGDSRAYRFTRSNRRLQQLTKDHSYVQLLCDTGVITPAEVATHPERNVITQCLGSPELQRVEVGERNLTWQADDWLILCSDGLSDPLSHSAMETLLAGADSVESAAEQLLKAALNAGGGDNISVIVLGLGARAKPLATAGAAGEATGQWPQWLRTTGDRLFSGRKKAR